MRAKPLRTRRLDHIGGGLQVALRKDWTRSSGGSGEDVDASARRVVDAKQDPREVDDLAARERGKRAFRSETWPGFIAE